MNQLRWQLSLCQAEDTDLMTSSLAGLSQTEVTAGSRRSALLVTAPSPPRPCPPPLRLVMGQMSPGSQLTPLGFQSRLTVSQKETERDGKLGGLLVFMDDLDFSSVVSKFDHVTGKYGTRCAIQETLYVLIQDVIFSHIKSSFFWCEYRNTLSFLFVL